MNYNSWSTPVEEIRSTIRRKKKPSALIELNDANAKITTFRLLRRSFLYQTKEFFKNSTLHGVRYIAEADRPVGERLMWFCFIVIGLISALVIIVSLWEKFQTNPTITGKWFELFCKWMKCENTEHILQQCIVNGCKCTISPFLSGSNLVDNKSHIMQCKCMYV